MRFKLQPTAKLAAIACTILLAQSCLQVARDGGLQRDAGGLQRDAGSLLRDAGGELLDASAPDLSVATQELPSEQPLNKLDGNPNSTQTRRYLCQLSVEEECRDTVLAKRFRRLSSDAALTCSVDADCHWLSAVFYPENAGFSCDCQDVQSLWSKEGITVNAAFRDEAEYLNAVFMSDECTDYRAACAHGGLCDGVQYAAARCVDGRCAPRIADGTCPCGLRPDAGICH